MNTVSIQTSLQRLAGLLFAAVRPPNLLQQFWTEWSETRLLHHNSPESLTSSSGSFVVPSGQICSLRPPFFFPPHRPPDRKLEQLLNLLTRLALFRFFEASSVFAGPLKQRRHRSHSRRLSLNARHLGCRTHPLPGAEAEVV